MSRSLNLFKASFEQGTTSHTSRKTMMLAAITPDTDINFAFNPRDLYYRDINELNTTTNVLYIGFSVYCYHVYW